MKIETYEFIRDLEKLISNLVKSDLHKLSNEDSFLHVVSEHFSIKAYYDVEYNDFELRVFVRGDLSSGKPKMLSVCLNCSDENIYFENWLNESYTNKLAEIPLVCKFIGKYAN